MNSLIGFYSDAEDELLLADEVELFLLSPLIYDI